jgi:hypothetical protein
LSQGSRCKIAEDGGRDPKFEALSLRNWLNMGVKREVKDDVRFGVSR